MPKLSVHLTWHKIRWQKIRPNQSSPFFPDHNQPCLSHLVHFAPITQIILSEADSHHETSRPATTARACKPQPHHPQSPKAFLKLPPQPSTHLPTTPPNRENSPSPSPASRHACSPLYHKTSIPPWTPPPFSTSFPLSFKSPTYIPQPRVFKIPYTQSQVKFRE